MKHRRSGVVVVVVVVVLLEGELNERAVLYEFARRNGRLVEFRSKGAVGWNERRKSNEGGERMMTKVTIKERGSQGAWCVCRSRNHNRGGGVWRRW